MPVVPFPSDLRQSSVQVGTAAQIDSRVLNNISAAGKAQGNAVAALGEAFGEVFGRVGAAQDEQNYAQHKLEWMKGDFAIKQDLQANAGEDGEYYRKAPELYADLNKRLDETYPVNDPKKKVDLGVWKQTGTWQSGKQATLAYQGARVNLFMKDHQGRVSDLESRITTGMITPEEVDQYHQGLNEQVDGMDRYILNRADADKLKQQTGGRIVRALEDAMLTKDSKLYDPKAAEDFGKIVRKLNWELDQPSQSTTPPGTMPRGSGMRSPIGGTFPVSGVDPSQVPTSGGAPNSREHMGPRAGGAHAGWDIPGKVGTPVVAAGEGRVVAAGQGEGYGNYVDVQYSDGTVHRMAHLQGYDPNLRPGTQVKEGQQLGALGHTGNAGPEFSHVHYEVFPNKSAYDRAQGGSSRATASLRINPRQYFAGTGGIETGGITPVATAYSPQREGSPDYKMQGGYAAAFEGPDGNKNVNTLQDFADGKAKYITLGGDTAERGKQYVIPRIEWIDRNGDQQVSENVPAVVHDRDDADGKTNHFQGRGNTRIDIAVDRDLTREQMNAQPFSRKGVALRPVPPGGSPQASQQAATERPVYAQAGQTRNDASPIATGTTVPAPAGGAQPQAAARPANPLGFLGDADENTRLADLPEDQRKQAKALLPPPPAELRPDDLELVDMGLRADAARGSGITRGYVRDLFGNDEQALQHLTVRDLRNMVGQTAGTGEAPAGAGQAIAPYATKFFGEEGRKLLAIANDQPDTPLSTLADDRLLSELSARFPLRNGQAWQDMTVGEAVTMARDIVASTSPRTQAAPPQQMLSDFPAGRLVPGQKFELNVAGQKFRLTSDMVNAAGDPDARKAYARRAKEYNDSIITHEKNAAVGTWMPSAESYMAKTGKTPEGYDQNLAIANRVFSKNDKELVNHLAKMRIARSLFDTFDGASELTPEQLRKRVDDLNPDPDDPQLVEKDKAYTAAEARLMRIEAMRNPLDDKNYDPAETVDAGGATQKNLGLKPTSLVREARSRMVRNGTPSNKVEGHDLIDARIRDQVRYGIDPGAVRPLKKSELDDFGIGVRGVVDGDYEGAIKKIYGRIQKTYGETHSGMILRQVLNAEIGRSRRHQTALQLMLGMEQDGTIEPSTLEGIEEKARLDRMEKVFTEPLPPSPGVFQRLRQLPGAAAESYGNAVRENWGAETFQNRIMRPLSGGQPLSPKPRMTPPEGAIQYLKENPGTLNLFEDEFGLDRGEGRSYLLQGGPPRRTRHNVFGGPEYLPRPTATVNGFYEGWPPKPD